MIGLMSWFCDCDCDENMGDMTRGHEVYVSGCTDE